MAYTQLGFVNPALEPSQTMPQFDPSAMMRIQNQQAMAAALMKQGNSPLEAVQAGQFRVAPSPWQGLAKVAQTAAGAAMLQNSYKQQKEYMTGLAQALGAQQQAGTGMQGQAPQPQQGQEPPQQNSGDPALQQQLLDAPAALSQDSANTVDPSHLAAALGAYQTPDQSAPQNTAIMPIDQNPAPAPQGSAQGGGQSSPGFDPLGAMPAQQRMMMAMLNPQKYAEIAADNYGKLALANATQTPEMKNAEAALQGYQQQPGGLSAEQTRMLMLGGNNLRPIALGAGQMPYSAVTGVPRDYQAIPKETEGYSVGFRDGKPVIEPVPGGLDAVQASSTARSIGEIPMEAARNTVPGLLRPVTTVDAQGNQTTNYTGNAGLPLPADVQNMLAGRPVGSPIAGALGAGQGNGQGGGVQTGIAYGNQTMQEAQGTNNAKDLVQVNQAAKAAQQSGYSIAQLQGILRQNPTLTGPVAQYTSELKGLFGDTPGLRSVLSGWRDTGANLQAFNKYAADFVGNDLARFGGQGATDARQELSQAANPSQAMLPEATQHILELRSSMARFDQQRAQYLNQFQGNSAGYTKATNDFNQNANIYAGMIKPDMSNAAEILARVPKSSAPGVVKAYRWLQQNKLNDIGWAQ